MTVRGGGKKLAIFCECILSVALEPLRPLHNRRKKKKCIFVISVQFLKYAARAKKERKLFGLRNGNVIVHNSNSLFDRRTEFQQATKNGCKLAHGQIVKLRLKGYV